jgi:hypothetical protein
MMTDPTKEELLRVDTYRAIIELNKAREAVLKAAIDMYRMDKIQPMVQSFTIIDGKRVATHSDLLAGRFALAEAKAEKRLQIAAFFYGAARDRMKELGVDIP